MQQKKLMPLFCLLTAIVGGFQYVVVNLFCDVSLSGELLRYRYGQGAGIVLVAAALSIVGFGLVSIILFKAPRLAYGVGLVAACLGWPYFIAWFLTVPDMESGAPPNLIRLLATLAAVFLLTATTSLLLPQIINIRLFRDFRSGEKRWPPYALFALLASGLILGRTLLLKPKVIIDGTRAQFAVAHVQKNGRDIQETDIFVMKDHRYFIERVRQRWFWPAAECTQFVNVLPPDNFQAINSLFQSSGFTELQTKRTTVPSRWGSDTWYISVPGRPETRFLVLSSVDQSTVRLPDRLVDWFNETARLPGAELMHAGGQCSAFSNAAAAAWQKPL